MKKYIIILVSLFSLFKGYSQRIQASIGTADNPSNIRIYLRPDITNPAVAISSLNFNVALPSSITPIPTLSLVSNSIPGVTWIIEPAFIEGSFIHYNIYNNQSLYTLNCSAGIEFQVLELSFSGGPQGVFANTAHLVTLPDAGVNGLTAFYCTSAIAGLLNSDGQNLYYARDASVTFANGDSYRYTGSLPNYETQRGTFTSFARLISGISLPVKFSSFYAFKQNNDAQLNWTVENQNSDVKQFDIERSFNGTSFTKIAQQSPIYSSNGTASYNITDGGVFDNYKGTVYYRIKQIDHNGTITYSIIRSLKINSKAFFINMYPNPTTDVANVVFKLDKAQPVTITLVDAYGKTVQQMNIQAINGLNQKTINVNKLAAGTYTFIVKTDNEIETIKFVKK